MNTKDFLVGFINHVIDWNQTITSDLSDERFELQQDITLSEIQETIEGIKDRNEREIIDGVGDIIVTAGYLEYLETGSKDYLQDVYAYDGDIDDRVDLLDLVVLAKFGTIGEYVDLALLHDILIKAEEIFGQAKVQDYLVRVLRSNESKFVQPGEFDEHAELALANEKYAGKFNDLVVTTGLFQGNEVKMIRADGGSGKLLKPSKFVEPEDIQNPVCPF